MAFGFPNSVASVTSWLVVVLGLGMGLGLYGHQLAGHKGTAWGGSEQPFSCLRWLCEHVPGTE